MNFQFINADQIDLKKLKIFWERSYGPTKAAFLAKYGEWWYRGLKNSFAITKDDEVAAYCALIPIQCSVAGKIEDACWWVDLIVAPEFRGTGLQRKIDERLKITNNLILGFPNRIAAKIHKKHGWGVREDGRVMMLPIDIGKIFDRPMVSPTIRMFNDIMHYISFPFLKLFRQRLKNYSPTYSEIVKFPDSKMLSGIFFNSVAGCTTTFRDRKFFEWRYFKSPYHNELTFFFSGNLSSPSHFLISRTLKRGNSVVTRILDICGDFTDIAKVKDLIKTAVKQAVIAESCQVTVSSWNLDLIRILRSVGFWVSTKSRFCWYSKDAELMDNLGKQSFHWTIGDSDQDEPK